MTESEIEAGKREIDAMTQEEMARMWRFTPIQFEPCPEEEYPEEPIP